MRDFRDLEDIMTKGKSLIEFYRDHPCIAAYDLLKVDFAPIQRCMFRDMWFKNYVIGVCGRGAGKTYMLGVLAVLSSLLYPGYRVGLIGPVFRQCFPIISDSYDTFWTNNGLKTTTEDFYNSIDVGISKTQSLKSQNTINNKWKNKERDCISIETKKGYEINGTIDHRVLVLDNDFNLVYKELQELDSNSKIVIKSGFNYFGNDDKLPNFDNFELNCRTKDCKIPNTLTTGLSYWMGLLVGDGCVSISKNKRKQRVDFVNEDQELLDFFEKYLAEYFVYDKKNISRDNRRKNTWEIQYYSKKLAQYLLKCGFTKTTALDKKIPAVIKKASRNNFVNFLQGLFDTDGGCYVQHTKKYKSCCVNFSTSSLQLAKEIHSVLLNLGIISNLGISKKAEERCLIDRKIKSKCSTGYKIRITGRSSLLKFKEEIGFRCKRKAELLDNYLNTQFSKQDSLARKLGLSKDDVDNNYDKCEKYLEQGLYFVKPKFFKKIKATSIDIEVENEHCYFANGFINHNSKLIFSEIEKLYNRSSIFKEATEKKPTRGSDMCYVKFKSVAGINGSYIEALPLADGSKIRGSRFYLICIDELAQVPDKVLDMVVRPMGATTLEPMENVRRIERQNRLIELGLATEDDFDESTVNKMVMTSSGFYKFNHMWRRMKDHWSQMEEQGADSQYSVWQIPYWDLPDGFLDINNIEEAKRIMTNAEFRMEYEADMISDSEGFFKASLLESCTIDSGFSLELNGDHSAKYVLGVDPNQGGDASCGITVIKLGSTNKIVNVLEPRRKTTQELTKIVQTLCDKYNIVRIFMDKGGGGKAVMDLLDEGYDGYEPLIDRTDDDKKHKKGLHILEMVNFNPSWISDANFTTKALLEDKKLRFPEPPVSTLDAEAIVYETINKLKSQMLSIIVTQTRSGLLHFDTPKKGQNKDLYSSIILAGHGVRILEKELEEPSDPLLHNTGGMIRSHAPGANWGVLDKKGPKTNLGRIEAAILKKKL